MPFHFGFNLGIINRRKDAIKVAQAENLERGFCSCELKGYQGKKQCFKLCARNMFYVCSNMSVCFMMLGLSSLLSVKAQNDQNQTRQRAGQMG